MTASLELRINGFLLWQPSEQRIVVTDENGELQLAWIRVRDAAPGDLLNYRGRGLEANHQYPVHITLNADSAHEAGKLDIDFADAPPPGKKQPHGHP